MIKQIIIILIFSCIFITGYSQNDWKVDPLDYEYSMTITGVILFNDSLYEHTSGIIVGAFVDDTVCVGRAESHYYSKVDKSRLPLMVYGNKNGKGVVLKAYIPQKNAVFTVAKTYEFYNDEIHGDYESPVIWDVDLITSVKKPEALSFVMYPNPATTQVSLVGIGESLVEVYDYSGKKIQISMCIEVDKCHLNIASLQVGFYLISVSDGHSRQMQKLVVK